MSFKEFLMERVGGGGAAAGQYEIVKTPLPTAIQLVDHIYKKSHTVSPKKVLPNFVENYKFAQRLATLGKTQRKDMPVIRRSDAYMLQRRLMRGALDIKEPFSAKTDSGNPFPQGLTGIQATQFLTNGFRDGKLSDDVVATKSTVKTAGSLKPIQQQIYLDKALAFGMKMQIGEFKQMLSKSFMISSSDNYIIDGHHRWLFAVLLDPNTPMATLEIDLPLADLLKLLTAYSDAIGNKRNQ